MVYTTLDKIILKEDSLDKICDCLSSNKNLRNVILSNEDMQFKRKLENFKITDKKSLMSYLDQVSEYAGILSEVYGLPSKEIREHMQYCLSRPGIIFGEIFNEISEYTQKRINLLRNF